eukprot:TRINITY_DN1856_c0_g1_i4.p1 TRINITY_DN1856_c0_g1~~TRINITY_DN1856_c0_g1_i4.p1  ORF type:complete len:318 (+),score=10.70 TRINITY_DN1856_c0_g1_i4:138-1091(+)
MTAVVRALRQPGGGVFNLARAQITDDSELAMCQLRALLSLASADNPTTYLTNSDGTNKLIEALAASYHGWYESNPFDIGTTTRNAFSLSPTATYGQDMLAHTAEVNHKSTSNGALMRMTPLAVLAAWLPDQVLIDWVCLDVRLSHPHPVCQISAVAYVLAVSHLVRHPHDRLGAIQRVETWLGQDPDPRFQSEKEVQAWHEVRQWLANASHNIDRDARLTDIKNGFVKHAFQEAFRHLYLNTPYEAALQLTIFKHGDTDTNAAIVGGMIGALNGASSIPSWMKDPVLTCQPNHNRPESLWACNLESLVRQLVTLRPA